MYFLKTDVTGDRPENQSHLAALKPNTVEMPASLRSHGVGAHPGIPFGFRPE